MKPLNRVTHTASTANRFSKSRCLSKHCSIWSTPVNTVKVNQVLMVARYRVVVIAVTSNIFLLTPDSSTLRYGSENEYPLTSLLYTCGIRNNIDVWTDRVPLYRRTYIRSAFSLLLVPFCNWFQKLVSNPVYRSHRTGTMSKGNWSNLAAKLVSLLHLLPQMFGCRRFGQHLMKFDSKTNPNFPKRIVGLLLLPFGRARFHPFPKFWSCNHLTSPFYLYTFSLRHYAFSINV